MVDSQTLAEAALLVQVQAQSREQITTLTQAAVLAEVRAFTGWYDSPSITTLAARLAKLTRAGQRQTAISTDAFGRRILRLLTNRRPAGRGPVDTSSGLRGIPLESVYGRLADSYRWLDSTRGPGAPGALLERPDAEPLTRLGIEEILSRVTTRAAVQVDDNLSLAFREQWASVLAGAPAVVVGYRRVLHPELARGGSCGLCVAASGNRYSRADLLPIHSRCNCAVMPVLGDADGNVTDDPGADLNEADLSLLYEKAGGTTAGRALKKTRFTVVQNSETGPRLVYLGHNHRTVTDAESDDAIAPTA